MKNLIVALPIVALVAAGTSGCATKTFVKDRVGEVNTKVETLSKGLEETQEQLKKTDARVGEAEQKIATVDQKAGAAGQSAATAQKAATAAAARAEEVDKATKRLIYEVTLSEDQGNFKFASAELPAEAAARLDEIASQLKANPNGGFIEVEGHTDSVGAKDANYKLGLNRAESVKRFLHEKHGIPLHKINVISYGSEKPVAPNTNRDGRAKNRRVVVRVVA